jgi:hypothetical protein
MREHRAHRRLIEAALASALTGASAAGRWDVVLMLARELQARREEGSEHVALGDEDG